MRVKISYTMDIKDVPEKVSDILYDSLTELKNATEMLSRAIKEMESPSENVSHALIAVDRARISMGSTDSSLTEVLSIMTGLENYYNGEQNVPDGRPIMDTSGNATTKT